MAVRHMQPAAGDGDDGVENCTPRPPETLRNTEMEPAAASSLAVTRDQAKVSVLGVPSQPGLASHILGTMARAHIEADVVVQNTGKDGKTDLSFTVRRNDCARTVELLRVQVLPALGAREVVADTGVCKIPMYSALI
eukprot:Opistho-1_new@68792